MTKSKCSGSVLLAAALIVPGCGGPTAGNSNAAAPSSAPTAAASSPAAAAARELAPQHRPQGDIEFNSAVDLKQTPGAVSPELRHGIVANTADWPASLYVTFPTPDGLAACTAALIGPEVMLTAAHCVPVQGGVTFKYKDQPTAYVATCTQHPQYVSNTDPSADYALCKLDRKFAEFTGFLYETVDTAAMASRLGNTIVLTGYGCVSDVAGVGPPDGKYRIGTNVIDQTSASPVNAAFGPALYAGSQDNNLFTKDDPQLANLCPGDSGGPAFVASTADFKKRVAIGVNSRVFYRDATKTTYGASLVSSTGTAEFIAWAKTWADPVPSNPTKRLAVCGLSGSPARCRT
jgi:V8-like Glu-specific endopeptidase